jgi:hypothetical protein
VVVLTAIVPTAIAQRFFAPSALPSVQSDDEVERAAGDTTVPPRKAEEGQAGEGAA